MAGGRLRIASAQYDIGFLRDWESFRAKIRQWVEEAAAEKAELLVFPEYFSMELASLFPEEVYRGDAESDRRLSHPLR